ADFVPMLEDMHRLSSRLFQRRLKRGSIDFDFPEAKVVLDSRGRPQEIRTERRSLATQIIEEFMILCNETVARHHTRRKLPYLYRLHQPPESDALEELESLLSLFRLRLRRRGNKIHPHHFQRLLEQIKERPEEYLI